MEYTNAELKERDVFRYDDARGLKFPSRTLFTSLEPGPPETIISTFTEHFP